MSDAYYMKQFIADEIYRALVGPDCFICRLPEPTDRMWVKELKPVVDRLNELHSKLEAALKLLEYVDPYNLYVEDRPLYEQLFGKEKGRAK